MPARRTSGADRAQEAGLACRFIIDAVEAREGRCAYQGQWPLPLSDCPSLPPTVHTVAHQRLRGVPRPVACALVSWAEGADVKLFEHVPPPEAVLELQARGARCVSLLSPGIETTPHADALAFALHDLCHLAKFLDPAHHAGQVGFFSTVANARKLQAWTAFERGLDTVLSDEWNHVISDMNGSAVFLFAAMKMKLKMAVRRRWSRELDAPPPQNGPLSSAENAAYEDAEAELFALLGLDGVLAAAAHATSAKRTDPHAASRLLGHFEAVGRAVLGEPQRSGPGGHQRAEPASARAQLV